jgi:uncharacterized oligopeptide transporter (OPT) family protein
VTAKIAAGVWFLFTLLMVGGLLSELSDPRPHILFLAVVLLIVTAWLGYRLLRRPTRTVAIIAGCVGAFFAVFFIMAILQGSMTPFPQGFAAIALAAAAGVLPLQLRESRAHRADAE